MPDAGGRADAPTDARKRAGFAYRRWPPLRVEAVGVASPAASRSHRRRRTPRRRWPRRSCLAQDVAIGRMSARWPATPCGSTNGIFSAAVGQRLRRSALSCHDDLPPVAAACRARRADETWLNRFSAASGNSPSSMRVNIGAPLFVAGERRQPHQILRDQSVRIGDRLIERRLRPHHQAFGDHRR